MWKQSRTPSSLFIPPCPLSGQEHPTTSETVGQSSMTRAGVTKPSNKYNQQNRASGMNDYLHRMVPKQAYRSGL